MQNNQLKVWLIATLVAYLGVAPPIYANDNQLGNDIASTDPMQRQAVVTLLDDAAKQVEQHQFDRAAASLERALRIDAKDAEIWHLLGQVKLYQGQYAQAEAMAAKSNFLATDNPSLQARNTRLLALARQPSAISGPPSLARAPTPLSPIEPTPRLPALSPPPRPAVAFVPETDTETYPAEDHWYRHQPPIPGQQGLTQWRGPVLADELIGLMLNQLALEFRSREPFSREFTEFDPDLAYRLDYLPQLVLELREAKAKRWKKLEKQAHKASKHAEKQERKRHKAWLKQVKKNHKKWKKSYKAKKKRDRD